MTSYICLLTKEIERALCCHVQHDLCKMTLMIQVFSRSSPEIDTKLIEPADSIMFYTVREKPKDQFLKASQYKLLHKAFQSMMMSIHVYNFT